jgi:hypothetical protein
LGKSCGAQYIHFSQHVKEDPATSFWLLMAFPASHAAEKKKTA